MVGRLAWSTKFNNKRIIVGGIHWRAVHSLKKHGEVEKGSQKPNCYNCIMEVGASLEGKPIKPVPLKEA